MTISYGGFIKKAHLEGFEDSEKYKSWEPKVKKYKEKLVSSIPKEFRIALPADIAELQEKGFNGVDFLYKSGVLSGKEIEITDMSAGDLLAKMALSELSAEEVFKAFAHRACVAHQLTNCAAEIFYDEGLERAKYLDKYLKEKGAPIGPLHGLPISLKEQMNYANKITHGGYVSQLTNVPEKHGVTTQVLENLGAVFYVRTNQPQSLMHLDSNNNITGATRNPYHLGLSPGGSSSGEGAIVTLGGSSIGVGSDIGGSIRAPAAFCGCHGLRPTSKRVSTSGGVSSGMGQESVLAVAGPLARSIDEIDLFMKHYINSGKPWELDGSLIPMKWRDVPVPDPKKLKVGIMCDDGLVKPSPPIVRALKFASEKLRAAGVDVVDFKPIKADVASDTVLKMYNCDGNEKQRQLLSASGEPLKELTKYILSQGDGSRPYSVQQNRMLNFIRDSLRTEYTEAMVKQKVDIILCPTYNNVAPRPEKIFNWSYTSLFNILDFPSLSLQTGLFQDPSIDTWDDDHKDYVFRNDLEKLECALYDPALFNGAPIALQVATRRYFDEELVAASKLLVKLFGTK